MEGRGREEEGRGVRKAPISCWHRALRKVIPALSSVMDGIRQAQCLVVAVPAASCSRSGSGETPVAKTGTGPRDDACVNVG